MSELVRVEIDFDKAMTLSKSEIQELILKLEAQIKDAPQVEIPLKHYFSERVYGREMEMKKGDLVIGKIHRFHAMNVITKGEVTVISIDGPMRIKAPHTFVSSPGAKRIIFAHEDSVWMNFHGTPETDIERIEKEFIAESFEDFEQLRASESKQIGESV